MRVMLLNQYFYPDIAATAQLATDLATDLVKRGHEVIAVAGEKSYAGTGPRLAAHEFHEGVEIVRVPAMALGRGNRLFRSIDYASFLLGALPTVLRQKRPDVIVALSTPPLVATLALLSRQLRKTKFVFWVMDVYPELAIRLGALAKNNVLAHALGKTSSLLLRAADGVIALDDAMRDELIKQGALPARVSVIDNWCDGAEIFPAPLADNSLRKQLGLGERFTISYSGNMGNGHDFDTLVAAMARPAAAEIAWLFIGDGPKRAALEAKVRGLGLPHVHFLPYRSREELNEGLTAAHASLVTLETDIAGLLVPSKFYGLLAAGIPVLYVGPKTGRVHTTIDEEQVGISVANGDVDGLARAIDQLQTQPGERAKMAARARRVFEQRFDRAIALDKHHALLQRLVHAC